MMMMILVMRMIMIVLMFQYYTGDFDRGMSQMLYRHEDNYWQKLRTRDVQVSYDKNSFV